jgi:hypothetical protein
MRIGYHKKYNLLLQKCSAKTLYSIVLSFAKKQGNPYPLESRGRKPKLLPYEYAAFLAYMILMHGAPYRKMECESELYTEKHIDHATFVVNFERIPFEYFITLTETAGTYLDRFVAYSPEYVVDSSTIMTSLTIQTRIFGKEIGQKIEYKSHIVASLHPLNNAVVIRKVTASSKFVADCEAAKQMLEKGGVRDVRLHGDRGYDYERVYKACYEHNVQPNIRPLEYKGPIDYRAKEGSLRLHGITEYDDGQRKLYRGRVEVVFGGTTNARLMNTRLKKKVKILSYCVILMLRHNILTIARQLAVIFGIINQTRSIPFVNAKLQLKALTIQMLTYIRDRAFMMCW